MNRNSTGSAGNTWTTQKKVLPVLAESWQFLQEAQASTWALLTSLRNTGASLSQGRWTCKGWRVARLRAGVCVSVEHRSASLKYGFLVRCSPVKLFYLKSRHCLYSKLRWNFPPRAAISCRQNSVPVQQYWPSWFILVSPYVHRSLAHFREETVSNMVLPFKCMLREFISLLSLTHTFKNLNNCQQGVAYINAESRGHATVCSSIIFRRMHLLLCAWWKSPICTKMASPCFWKR